MERILREKIQKWIKFAKIDSFDCGTAGAVAHKAEVNGNVTSKVNHFYEATERCHSPI